MPSYEWLQPDERNKRRSIADATDLLPSDGAWRGEIRVGGLRRCGASTWSESIPSSKRRPRPTRYKMP